MKKALFLAVIAVAALSFAQKKPAAQTAIDKQIAKYVQAFMKRDLNGTLAIFTPDYKSVGINGQTADRTKFSQTMASLFKAAKSLKLVSAAVSFKVDKGVIHVVRRSSLDAEFPGQSGKLSKFHSDSKTDEVWVLSGGTYKVKSAKQISATRTLDGKKMSG
jgi:hypothetical protein